MYKAIKDEKIIAISDTDNKFPCLVKDEVVEDAEHTTEDYEQYNGEYVLKEDYPVDVRNEEIRQQRKARYETESDPIRLDYDEALARGQDNAEELKQQWLHSKDVIREELPYIVVEEIPHQVEEVNGEEEVAGSTEQEEIS